jgi:DNA polymerase (family 10)
MADLRNAAIADQLESLAGLLDLAGAHYYAVRAYRRAAELVRSTPAPVADLVRDGRVRELRGIGDSIERRLVELVETGEIAELKELEDQALPELVGLGRLIGVGPQRMVEIARALGVRTADEFRAAAQEGRLTSVHGVGPSLESKVLTALARPKPKPRRGLLLNRARALSLALAEALGAEVAGDVRRWRDTCEHLALVKTSRRPASTIERFVSLPQIVAVVEREPHRALGVTVEGVPVELLVPLPEAFGTALVRATGSAEYVAALEPLPAAPTEEAVYLAIGVPWCPPELRERPHRDPPPPLVELAQIRGDLHCHTTWSDGKATVLEMGRAAIELGYEYIAICDHTRNVRVVPGLDADDVRRQGEEIAAANAQLGSRSGAGEAGTSAPGQLRRAYAAPFRVLRGSECDILPDGSLDLPDDVLAELDWVQVSLHAGQRWSREKLTPRVLAGISHPAARCLSHPFGRIINHRPENALDLERVIESCLEHGVALEVNGLPDRLDMRDVHVREAVAAGVPIVCSTDAHSTRGLGNMVLSVHTARRGAAGPQHVLNTRPLAGVLR